MFNDLIAFLKKYMRFVSSRTSALKITRFAFLKMQLFNLIVGHVDYSWQWPMQNCKIQVF